ncbi:hypothetical protein RJ55_04409 [Drechmeria coniospora]|nr:hypothetical protein RJ55_04409 [Drechmeria coniospora]
MIPPRRWLMRRRGGISAIVDHGPSLVSPGVLHKRCMYQQYMAILVQYPVRVLVPLRASLAQDVSARRELSCWMDPDNPIKTCTRAVMPRRLTISPQPSHDALRHDECDERAEWHRRSLKQALLRRGEARAGRKEIHSRPLAGPTNNGCETFAQGYAHPSIYQNTVQYVPSPTAQPAMPFFGGMKKKDVCRSFQSVWVRFVSFRFKAKLSMPSTSVYRAPTIMPYTEMRASTFPASLLPVPARERRGQSGEDMAGQRQCGGPVAPPYGLLLSLRQTRPDRGIRDIHHRASSFDQRNAEGARRAGSQQVMGATNEQGDAEQGTSQPVRSRAIMTPARVVGVVSRPATASVRARTLSVAARCAPAPSASTQARAGTGTVQQVHVDAIEQSGLGNFRRPPRTESSVRSTSSGVAGWAKGQQ